uniref:Uncharacterized protein n=1 Tax=Strigamia maritima TaxID=126957 RepID=T1JNJ0_STRMM
MDPEVTESLYQQLQPGNIMIPLEFGGFLKSPLHKIAMIQAEFSRKPNETEAPSSSCFTNSHGSGYENIDCGRILKMDLNLLNDNYHQHSPSSISENHQRKDRIKNGLNHEGKKADRVSEDDSENG